MRHRFNFRVVFILFFLISAFASVASLKAQENDENTQASTAVSVPDDKKEGELQPPSQEVGPSVMKWPDTFVWRAVTTGTGSYPFAYFFTNLAFDLVRFGISGFDYSFAPWPFRNQNSAVITDGEKIARIGTAFGISLGIGLLDSIFSKP